MYNHRMKKVSIGDDLSRRKPPESKKYANVRPITDTGKTVTKAAESWEELNVNVRYKRGEYFRRIKAETLTSLMQAEEDGDEVRHDPPPRMRAHSGDARERLQDRLRS